MFLLAPSEIPASQHQFECNCTLTQINEQNAIFCISMSYQQQQWCVVGSYDLDILDFEFSQY